MRRHSIEKGIANMKAEDWGPILTDLLIDGSVELKVAGGHALLLLWQPEEDDDE